MRVLIMSANDRQVGGTHYQVKGTTLQHWDLVHLFQWDYFTAQIIKYLMRWKLKNGVQDLEKARHFLDKYIELAKLSEVFLAAAKEDQPNSQLLDEITKIVSNKTPGHLTQGDPCRYIGWTYEGGTREWDQYRCESCHDTFEVQPGSPPPVHDNCAASPAPHGYVDQDNPA